MPQLKALTSDNDQAFSQSETIANALGAKSDFVRSYTSQERYNRE